MTDPARQNFEEEGDGGKPRRCWDFTLFNPTELEVKNIIALKEHAKVLVVSREICPKTGTLHLQGRIHWAFPRRFTAVKKEWPRCHWTYSRVEKHNSYPIKGDSEVLVNVDNRKPGTRNDITHLMQMLEDGKSEEDCWREHPGTMARSFRAMERWRSIIRTRNVRARYNGLRWPLITNWERSIICWGHAGIGKSQWALQHFNKPLLVTHLDDLGHFDTAVHDGIIFDDMDLTYLPRSTQIHLVEQEMPRSIHIRYGTAYIPADTKKIFLTNLYEGRCLSIEDPAIERRVIIIHASWP